MTDAPDRDPAEPRGATLEQLRAANAASAFNRWAGFDLVAAAAGRAELVVAMRPELRQHAGLLHAGVAGALLDTACGFAAATLAGGVLASQYSIAFYRPARGDRFVARATVVRAGRRQLFVNAEIHELGESGETLVAGGTATLVPAA